MPTPGNEQIRETVTAALQYWERGWCVIPAGFGSKKPEIDWKKYQKSRPGKNQVSDWFDDGNLHNIAIVCGAVSVETVFGPPSNNKLVVLVYNKVEDWENLPPSVLMRLPVVKSKRGYHVYTLMTGEVKSRIYAGGRWEVKSDGTYVIAPPSLHPSGEFYTWVQKGILRQVTQDELRHAADLLGIELDSRLPGLARKRLIPIPESIRPAWARQSVPPGQRNDRTFRVACYFYGHYRKDEAEKRIRAWAEEFCDGFPDDSFTEDEFNTTVTSAYRTLTGVRL